MRSLKLFSNIWPILTIFVSVLLFFYPVWLQNKVPLPADFVVGSYFPWLDYKWGYEVGVPVKNPIMADVVSFTYPMQMLAVDLLKKGEWPLWNPYILGGTPLLANFQSAPFSPTNVVYFLFDKLSAWSIQIILQHILAAFFAYLLLRNWKLSQFASMVGGIAFAFSGFNTLWSQWNGHTLAAAFIPLILLFEDKWLLSGRGIFGVGLSISIALQMLSGYPQVMFYSFLAMGVLWFVRMENSSVFVKKTIFLTFFGLLGLGLSAFQILPGAELLSLSQREIEPHPFDWAFLPFAKIITFFAPDYFGNHATGNYWGPQDYTSNTGFVGVVAAVFAGLAISLVKKQKGVIFSFILLVVSLVFAFPSPVSIFLWKSGFLGFQAASAHRVLVLSNLAVALLVGFGVEYFLQSKQLRIKWAFLVPGITVVGFTTYAIIFFFLSQSNPDIYHPLVRGMPQYIVALRNSVIPLSIFFVSFIIVWFFRRQKTELRKTGVVILCTVLLFELFRFGWKFTSFSPRHIVFPTTPVLEFLIEKEKPVRITGSQVIPINMRMAYGLESLEGYDAAYPLNMSKFIAAINSESVATNPAGRYGIVDNVTSPLLELSNTVYYLAVKKDEENKPSPTGNVPPRFNPERFRVVFEDKSVAVLESKNALPRAFMVFHWEEINDDTLLLGSLLNKNFSIREKILLAENPGIQRVDSKEVKNSVRYKKYIEQESELIVTTESSGMLFVSETFYPGWKAYVDGKESKIYRANYTFRAVEIPQGEHELVMKYEPASFYNGLKISGISLLFLFLILVLRKWYAKST